MMVSEKRCYFRDCARGNYSCVTHLSLLSDFCPQCFPWISSVTQFSFFYFVYTSVHVLLIEGKYVMGKVMEQKAFMVLITHTILLAIASISRLHFSVYYLTICLLCVCVHACVCVCVCMRVCVCVCVCVCASNLFCQCMYI